MAHEIKASDFESFRPEIIFAANLVAGSSTKRLIGRVVIQDSGVSVQFECLDMTQPEGFRLNLITWDIKHAVDVYNSME